MNDMYRCSWGCAVLVLFSCCAVRFLCGCSWEETICEQRLHCMHLALLATLGIWTPMKTHSWNVSKTYPKLLHQNLAERLMDEMSARSQQTAIWLAEHAWNDGDSGKDHPEKVAYVCINSNNMYITTVFKCIYDRIWTLSVRQHRDIGAT